MGTIRLGEATLACELAAGDVPGRCSWCGVRLPPRRRRWCSDDCAHAFADNHFWTPARRLALDTAGHVCQRCDRRTLDLQVHHIELAEGYGRSCRHHQTNLEVLCADCHRSEHNFQRDVERYLRWADGHVSLQLELPGVAAV